MVKERVVNGEKNQTKTNFLKANSDPRDHSCPPNQGNSHLIATNGDFRQGISKWERSYLNEKFSHPPSSAFLHQLPEVTSNKKPLRPCNVWSETFWEILKVTHIPRGMVIHFFPPSLLCSLLSPIYFFFFLTAAFLITVSQWLYRHHLLIVNQPIPWRQRAIVEVVSNLFCSMDFLLCMHAKPLLSHI